MKSSEVENMFYTPNSFLSLEEATAKALDFLKAIKETDEDLVDYWFGIAENWDVNIWLDIDEPDYRDEDDRFLRVTLYPVGEGVADYEQFYRLTLRP